jgi:hypothetical protein
MPGGWLALSFCPCRHRNCQLDCAHLVGILRFCEASCFPEFKELYKSGPSMEGRSTPAEHSASKTQYLNNVVRRPLVLR